MTVYPGQTLIWMTLGQLCTALWDAQSQPVGIQPGIEPGSVVMLSSTDMQCLRLLRHSGVQKVTPLGLFSGDQEGIVRGQCEDGVGKALCVNCGGHTCSWRSEVPCTRETSGDLQSLSGEEGFIMLKH